MIESTMEDILSLQGNRVILHQVNALGYGAIGLMGRIRQRFPDMFKEYHELCGWFRTPKLQNELMGTFQALPFKDTNVILCNAFSQRFINDTKYEADPDSWRLILKKVKMQIDARLRSTGEVYEVHAPAKIGIGMKPEEVSSLREIVEEEFEGSSTPLFVFHT